MPRNQFLYFKQTGHPLDPDLLKFVNSDVILVLPQDPRLLRGPVYRHLPKNPE
jgi:hypothetical protein